MSASINAPSQRLRSLLLIGRCGRLSRALSRRVVRALPARAGGEVLAYMLLGQPRHGHPAVRVEREGATFVLDLSDGIDRQLYLDTYEAEIRRTVLPLVRAGDRVIDVGASCGVYALGAAARGATVVALEPVPSTHARLRRNIAANPQLGGRIEALQLAASDRDGHLRLFTEDHLGNSVLASAHRQRPSSVATEVGAGRLDELVDPAPSARLLKIDVEGHEHRVLDGADRLLAEASPAFLLIEVIDEHLRQAGSSSAALIADLAAHGYAATRAFPVWPRVGSHMVANPDLERPGFAATVLFEHRPGRR